MSHEEEPIPLPLGRSVVIDASGVREKLAALPDRVGHARGRVWTKEEDAALLEFWPIKRHSDIARMLGVAAETARTRYERLIAEKRG